MSYATPSDLLTRKDARTIKALASDTGADIADPDTDPNLLQALEDASGEVDSAVLVAKIYSTAELATLTGNSLALLKRITCEVAMAFLFARRPKYDEDGYDKALERCNKWLDRLRKGERVFDLEPQQDAGLPSVDGPSAVDYSRMNLLVDRTKGYYPARGNRLPSGRGGS